MLIAYFHLDVTPYALVGALRREGKHGCAVAFVGQCSKGRKIRCCKYQSFSIRISRADVTGKLCTITHALVGQSRHHRPVVKSSSAYLVGSVTSPVIPRRYLIIIPGIGKQCSICIGSLRSVVGSQGSYQYIIGIGTGGAIYIKRCFIGAIILPL